LLDFSLSYLLQSPEILWGLTGSRENEVRRTIRTVLEAVDALQRPAEQLVQTSLGIPMKLTPLTLAGGGCVVKRPVRVIFPTITAVEAIVRQEIDTFCNASGAPVENFQILVDADSKQRYKLFQSADAAVAVSGTIVTETALAALPTVVIYRANRITEILAKQLSAVQYVSIPNLLLGRYVDGVWKFLRKKERMAHGVELRSGQGRDSGVAVSRLHGPGHFDGASVRACNRQLKVACAWPRLSELKWVAMSYADPSTRNQTPRLSRRRLLSSPWHCPR
jgi:hypothetical protein